MIKNLSDFNKFVFELKKLFRNPDYADKLFYENTYAKLAATEVTNSVIINTDKITVELKKYSYTLPDKHTLFFYRVVAQFEKNAYHNSFLKLVFDQPEKANKFYTKVLSFIKLHMP